MYRAVREHMRFTYYSPTKIVFEEGVLEKIGVEARKLGDKALLVTGRTFAKKYGYIDKICSLLKDQGLECAVFSKVEPNPSYETVEKGAKIAREEKVDLVIGFGGGSAMDAAKAIAVLAVKEGSAKDYIYPKIIEEEVLPIIAVPTTCGTGSEVTKYSVLTDRSSKRKTVMVGPGIIPKVALLDPSILEHLPPDLTAYTAFDAFSHAVEAYWSKRSQPISDVLAVESIALIVENLVKAYEGDYAAKEKLFLASMLAGLAINAAGTTLIHALGYPLTVYYDLHHGLANGLLLPAAIEFNRDAVPVKLDYLARRLGFSSVEDFVRKVEELLAKTGVKKLRDYGITENKIAFLAEEAITYSRNLANNPKEVSLEDARQIFLKIF